MQQKRCEFFTRVEHMQIYCTDVNICDWRKFLPGGANNGNRPKQTIRLIRLNLANEHNEFPDEFDSLLLSSDLFSLSSASRKTNLVL